jgi:hypothetical protein
VKAIALTAMILMTASAVAAQVTQTSAPGTPDVQATVAKARAAVKDPASNEASLAAVRGDLLKIAAQLERAAGTPAKDADMPASAAQGEVRELLAAIERKLGPAPEPPAGRAARASGMPVPVFEDGRATHAAAEALRKAQVKLSEQMRTAGPAQPPSDELVADLIVEQERLAWEAGWPFTPEEAAQLKALKAKQDQAKGGRPDVAAANDIDRQIADLVAKRRARGINVINAQLAREAMAVGRPVPAPFVVHRPATKSGQRLVDSRMAELIAAETGLQLQPGGPGLMMLAIGTKTFDDSVAGALRIER